MKLLLKRALLIYTYMQHTTLDFFKWNHLELDCLQTVKKLNQIKNLGIPEHL